MPPVDDFIVSLPKDERFIVKRLRALIFEAEPRIQEKLSYGVPYFFRHRRICFLWPASAVPCAESSSIPQAPNVTFGFCYGNQLSNEQGVLISDGRKQVYTISINSASEINERLLREILNEAILVDQLFAKKNSKQRLKF